MAGVESLRVGDEIAGKYRIERVVGAGGMGIVVSAMHLHLQQSVAIKLTLNGASRASEKARFMREARAAATLKSEHCVRVLDVDVLPSGEPYTVMELLTGVSLKELLEEQGTLPVATACAMIIEALDAVVEAHAAGIVHRDLKPANLFHAARPGRDPIVKILDFGISKLVVPAEGDVKLTGTQELIGSPAYMAPEQFTASHDVDARADIWSLGVILYELISGQLPFRGTAAPELYVKIATAPPIALSSLRPDVPPALEQIILRCLEKKPEDRFATARDLADALVPFTNGAVLPAATSSRRRSATPLVAPPVPQNGTSIMALSTQAGWSMTGGRSRALWTRRNYAAIIAGVSLAFGAIITIAFLVGRSSAPVAAAPPPEAAPSVAIAAPPPAATVPAVPEPAVEAAAPHAPVDIEVTAPTTTTSRPVKKPSAKPIRRPATKSPETVPSSMTQW